MKTLFTAATLAAAFALAGCNTTHDHDAAPGATSGDCCGKCGGGEAAPGATSGACSTSCSDKAECGTSCSDKAAPGAVSGECSKSCSDKAATCPFTGSCSDKG
jgi:hypothetical protein